LAAAPVVEVAEARAVAPVAEAQEWAVVLAEAMLMAEWAEAQAAAPEAEWVAEWVEASAEARAVA
jgi:hypothetical protein